jgi:hypothetical protein
MRSVLKKMYYSILKKLPTKAIAYIEILRTYHKILDLKNPTYFGEKMQWVKVFADLDKYSVYADKYAVREYVEQTVGADCLIKLHGVYKSEEEIPFDELPERFVLKVNHGSGYNIICKDKRKLDIKKTKETLHKWLNEDFAAIKGEEQYRNIPRRIVCEEYMEDETGGLLDYKYFCFNGEIKMIEVCFDRFEELKIDFYDKRWKRLPVLSGNPKTGHKNNDVPMAKPDYADKMAEVVEKLCKQFPFVRTDLYVVNGKVYFGELTFISGSGSDPFYPLSEDKKIAGWIDLDKYPKK